MARRRIAFAVRVLLLALLLFGPLLIVIGLGALFPTLPDSLGKPLLLVSGIWLFSAILLTPAVLFRDRGPSSGPADSDGGGGGGTEPPSAPVPMPPSGGVPLSDADPAPVRLRDHDRRGLRRLRLRRPAREPDRAPMPAPPAGDR